MHALPPPPKGPAPLPDTGAGENYAGPNDYLLHRSCKHCGLFWNATDTLGIESGKRKWDDFDAAVEKYDYLDPAFYQHKGPALMPVDEALEKHYKKLQGERMEAAMMAASSARTNLSMGRTQKAQAGFAEESTRNDAAVNGIMQRNPELARRYVALTQQLMSLMQKGKFDEADEIADEIDELEASYPELAALNSKEQARSDSLSKTAGAEEDAIEAAANKDMDQAAWGTAMEYIKALEKVPYYYTLIVIDNTLTGYEKDYSSDRAVVDADTADRVDISGTDSFGIKYKQSFGDPDKAATKEEPPPEEKKDDLKEEAKKLLKKWKPF